MADETQTVAHSLASPDIHREWESRYRTPGVVPLQDDQIDFIARLIGAHQGASVLDVGCGAGANAVRLARRGIQVEALDFSEAVLESAREKVHDAGLADLVSIRWGDVTALPHPTASVERILCWGVLMHITEIDRAVAELSRVLRPGGQLVICEGNVRAPDEVALRILDRLGRTTSARRAPAGMERWRNTSAGPLFARRTNLCWLSRAFADHGLVLRHTLPCQLTEAYVYLPDGSFASQAVHRLNAFWFHVIRTPRVASTVFMVFARPTA
jgi:2-polyprenyl-3-methyl-5-hydroxy-6-metoxy-1,4-benzoquinol methylase